MRQTRSRIPWHTVGLLSLTVLTPVAVAQWLRIAPPLGAPPMIRASAAYCFPISSLPLIRRTLGPEPSERPLITNVQIIDLDRDGQPDIVACDAQRGHVYWHRRGRAPDDKWQEHDLCSVELAAPAHATAVDLDGDGDLDVIVAVLGSVWPTNERVGRVVWLENRGQPPFEPHILIDDLRRVSDVQAGDLDADGDQDLVIAEFGFDQGSILWLEQSGPGRFRDHELLALPGAIHVPIADFDLDGDLDVVALVSQEEEAVWGFENLGAGRFEPRRRLLYESLNFDLGSAGLVMTDLDRDGDADLLLAAGDSLEIVHPYPQPWHGCIWLENEGGWKLTPHRIACLGGVYAAAAGDLDADGDVDVVLASMFNAWRQPGAASLVWLENDGQQGFRPWQIADRPTHLATVACGDLNGDGRADIVAGSLHLTEPLDRLGRLTTWISRSPGAGNGRTLP